MQDVLLLKVTKVGDGMYVNIPKHIRDQLYIERGDYLIMAVYEMGTIVLRKATPTELQNLKPKNIQYGAE